MEHDAGIGAAGVAVGREQRLQARARVRDARIDVAHRARRANRRAPAATGAEMRLDLDVIAVGLDRAARADVDALVAPLLPRTAVRADAGVVRDLSLIHISEPTRLLSISYA